MSVFSGTSVLGDQFLGSISPVVNGTLRLVFPGKPSPPAVRVGYIYVFAVNNTSPNQAYVIDSQLLHRPGLAVNYGTSLLATGFSMQVRVTWNLPGLNWQLTIT